MHTRLSTWSGLDSTSLALVTSLCVFAGCGAKPTPRSNVLGQAPIAVHHPAPPSDVRLETIALEDGRSITIQHGARKDPAAAGCADGTREAFHDDAVFPRIAGCMASWSTVSSMRAPATGRGCGDGIGPCAVPADACAAGWHPCGNDGSVAELRQVTADQCERAGGGRFSAAISHCLTQSMSCEYDATPAARYSCFDEGWCSEPVCCGNDCGEFGSCTGGVWPERTHIPVGQDQGCNRMTGMRAGGVLCCR